MAETSGSPPDRLSEFEAEVDQQVEDLCEIHDHITRVIANLDIDDNWFAGYDDPGRAKFELDAVVKMYLYQHTREFNDSQLERRLKGATFVYIQFGLPKPLSQQIINYTWANRFSLSERQTIQAVAERIREIGIDHEILRNDEPALDPDDVKAEDGIGEEQIRHTVKNATELGFDEFSGGRASNFKYPLNAFFERQGLLNIDGLYTTSPQEMFNRATLHETHHGSTHNRTMKKVATPDTTTTLSDFENGRPVPKWKQIRDTILPAFHAGVEKQLDEIAGRDRDGIREPTHAAFDITTFSVWTSPFRDKENVGEDEEPVVGKNGREVYPKDDYPEMVSGFKDPNKKDTGRGYKFATLTIVGKDTPIVLAIEPVRDERWWEKADESADVERTSRVEVVKRLLDQAEQHVDIHKVFCDREFDIHAVRDAIAHRHEVEPQGDSPPIQYVMGKKENANMDAVNIKEIVEDPIYNSRIEHCEGWHNGRMHKLSLVYLPGDDETDSDGYSMFAMNGWIGPDRADALVEQYRQRWTIENQYKTIKENFLPQTASTDYRIRFLYFVIGVILHNVWRLANFVLRDEVAVNLGESPPLIAKQIVQLLSKFLFDPGDPFTL